MIFFPIRPAKRPSMAQVCSELSRILANYLNGTSPTPLLSFSNSPPPSSAQSPSLSPVHSPAVTTAPRTSRAQSVHFTEPFIGSAVSEGPQPLKTSASSSPSLATSASSLSTPIAGSLVYSNESNSLISVAARVRSDNNNSEQQQQPINDSGSVVSIDFSMNLPPQNGSAPVREFHLICSDGNLLEPKQV